ncbi:hypothetical protein B0J14DRAFT_265748 [Halenospora varia]|nr:hypothetical protein B0J14DRAFT_265748 [Halenospora varia]
MQESCSMKDAEIPLGCRLGENTPDPGVWRGHTTSAKFCQRVLPEPFVQVHYVIGEARCIVSEEMKSLMKVSSTVPPALCVHIIRRIARDVSIRLHVRVPKVFRCWANGCSGISSPTPSICGLLHPSRRESADVVRKEIRIVTGTTALRGSTIHFPCSTVVTTSCMHDLPWRSRSSVRHRGFPTSPASPAYDIRAFQNTKIFRFRSSKLVTIMMDLNCTENGAPFMHSSDSGFEKVGD